MKGRYCVIVCLKHQYYDVDVDVELMLNRW